MGARRQFSQSIGVQRTPSLAWNTHDGGASEGNLSRLRA